MDNTIEQYKNWLTVNGQSSSTVYLYCQRIEKILKIISIDNLTEESISNYLLSIKDQFKPSTVNGYRDAIYSFLKFLKKNITIPGHLKIAHMLPKYIEEKYFIKKIVPEIDNTFRNGLKVKTLLYFMFYTGIRVSEIECLERKNFDLENRTVKIYIPKTREERIVIYTAEVRDFLKVYFSMEAEEKNAFNMSTTAVKATFDRLKIKFDDINLHPHLFRHSFATMLLKKGMNYAVISRLLGHHSFQTTMRYLGLDTETTKKQYDDAQKTIL